MLLNYTSTCRRVYDHIYKKSYLLVSYIYGGKFECREVRTYNGMYCASSTSSAEPGAMLTIKYEEMTRTRRRENTSVSERQKIQLESEDAAADAESLRERDALERRAAGDE